MPKANRLFEGFSEFTVWNVGVKQVSPAKDVNRMEDEIDKLRTDNFNLKIRIGDLESSGGINDFHRHLAPQGLINSDSVTPGANGGSVKARVGGADTSHDISQSNMHTDQDTVVYGDASEVGLSSSWWKSFSASPGASNSSAPTPFVKKQASSDSSTLATTRISTDDAIEFSRSVVFRFWSFGLLSCLSTETASILIEAHNLNCRSNLKPQSKDSVKWDAQESSFSSLGFHILRLFVSCRSTVNKRFFVNAYLPSMLTSLS